MGMKKIILFAILIFSTYSTYSQYKIKINWNKPKQKPVALPKIEGNHDVFVEKKLIDTNTDTNKQLNKFVTNWLGVRYVFGGDSKRGIDCSAFVRRAYKSVYDKVLPRTCIYQYKMVQKITKDCLEIGDLIFFRVRGGSGWHVGIFIGDKRFVHASGRGRNVMISSLEEDFYKRIYLSGGRL